MASEEDKSLSKRESVVLAASGPLGEPSALPPASIGDLVERINAYFPPDDAESWDRTGLLVGDPFTPVRGVACALDPTLANIRQAHACGANLLITHHPAFLDAPELFAPTEAGASSPGAVVFEASRLGVALANWHTALDVSAPAQLMLPGFLGLTPQGVLNPLARDARLGLGQLCEVGGEGIRISELARRCHEVFDMPNRVWGDATQIAKHVCTWTGAAGDAAWECAQRGIDVLVCGEVKYHAALDAVGAGLAIIELGHDVSELPFADVLARACVQAGVTPDTVRVLNQGPAWTCL